MADLISRDLSTATKAVVIAFTNDPDWMKICEEERTSLAAALRAAAYQVVIKLGGLGQESAWYLEEIAAELEAQ